MSVVIDRVAWIVIASVKRLIFEDQILALLGSSQQSYPFSFRNDPVTYEFLSNITFFVAHPSLHIGLNDSLLHTQNCQHM